MRYRRAHAPGGTYFFTVNLADRTSSLLTEQIEALRNAVRYVK
jgi:putative transposase